MGIKQEKAKAAAENILKVYSKDIRYPIDPLWIARSMGIEIKEVESKSDIAGGIWLRAGHDPVIFINNKDLLSRKRFTCAHEIGHYVLALERNEENLQNVDFRDSFSATGLDDDEVFANSFAACLLMPEEEVRKLFGSKGTPSLSDLIKGSNKFGVSIEALKIRLNYLGIAKV